MAQKSRDLPRRGSGSAVLTFGGWAVTGQLTGQGITNQTFRRPAHLTDHTRYQVYTPEPDSFAARAAAACSQRLQLQLVQVPQVQVSMEHFPRLRKNRNLPGEAGQRLRRLNLDNAAGLGLCTEVRPA